MTSSDPSLVAAAFPDKSDAEAAVKELAAAGFGWGGPPRQFTSPGSGGHCVLTQPSSSARCAGGSLGWRATWRTGSSHAAGHPAVYQVRPLEVVAPEGDFGRLFKKQREEALVPT
jgi:hypothetical protein